MTKEDDTSEPGPAEQETTMPRLLDEAGVLLDKAKRKRARRPAT